MEDWEKGKFEKEWRDAFVNAEDEGSTEAAWKNIDLQLSQAEGKAMKRSVIFYQRLAAASILFALISVAVALYNSTIFESTTTPSLAQQPTQNRSIPGDKNSPKQPAGGVEQSDQLNSTTDKKDKGRTSGGYRRSNVTLATSSPQATAFAQTTQALDERVNYRQAVDQRLLNYPPLAVVESQVNLISRYREVTLYRQLPAFPASYMANSPSKKSNKEQVWASVGAAAGTFSPNLSSPQAYFSAGMPNDIDASSRSGYSKSSDVGSAYTFGFSMGTKFSKRWVMQGGINYLNQSLGYQSNLQQLDASNQYSTALVGRTSGQPVKVTTPYQISSINEIISVPLQAGYLIVDRKFGFQLNTGFATDLFLRNSLVDESGQLKRSTEGAGSSSPYRTMSWAGLLNSELSYRIGDRYRVSIVPGLRYSLNSVFKSESGSVSNPLVTDVGFRFRYIFR